MLRIASAAAWRSRRRARPRSASGVVTSDDKEPRDTFDRAASTSHGLIPGGMAIGPNLRFISVQYQYTGCRTRSIAIPHSRAVKYRRRSTIWPMRSRAELRRAARAVHPWRDADREIRRRVITDRHGFELPTVRDRREVGWRAGD